MNFLLVGTCDGNIYLSVFGLFSCGVVNIKKHVLGDENERKHISVLDAEMSSDMKSVFLLVAVDEEKVYVESTKEESEVDTRENITEPENENSQPSTAEKGCQTNHKLKTSSSRNFHENGDGDVSDKNVNSDR